MKLDTNAKRLLIYYFYDKAGKLDKYVSYYLRRMKEYVSDIVFVLNGELNQDGIDEIEDIGARLIEKQCFGFNMLGYKAAVDDITIDGLKEYDEVIFSDYSIMGPVYPLSETFDKMNDTDVDFWAMTKYFSANDADTSYDYIQSHFIVYRKSVTESEAFSNYWASIAEAIDMSYELRLTRDFVAAGFKYEMAVYQDDLRTISYQPVVGSATKMVNERRCPLVKRHAFTQDYSVVLDEGMGNEAYELYQYIDKKTDYDADMILENLLRLENQADLKKNLQWNYILPSDIAKSELKIKKERIALAMHIYFGDLIEECAGYAKNMPDGTDMYITVNSEANKKKAEEVFSKLNCGKLVVRVVPNIGRDVAPYLVEFREFLDNYDIVCHAHDKKSGQTRPGSIGTAFAYKCFENILGTKEYVQNIINLFAENKRLGFITPPPPNHAEYYIIFGLEWGLNFANTKEFAESLGIDVPMDEKKEPIAGLGSFYWARTDAIKAVFKKKWTYDDFPKEPLPIDGTLLHAIERIYSFAAQAKGYYPGWIMSDKLADMEVTNLNHMIRSVNDIIFFTGNDAGSFHETKKNLRASYNRLKKYEGHFDGAGQSKLFFENGPWEISRNFFLDIPIISAGTSIEEDGTEKVIASYNIDLPYGFSMLKFDYEMRPEGKFKLYSMAIRIVDEDGKATVLELFDKVSTNGIVMDDGIQFLIDNPRVSFELKDYISVKNMTVMACFSEGINNKALEFITRKLTDEEE